MLRKNKDGSRVPVECPLPVKFYNQHMGEVDMADCNTMCIAVLVVDKVMALPFLLLLGRRDSECSHT